jgi:hypothetical protein
MSTITGTIREIYNTQQVSDKFAKRDIVVTVDEKYPQHITIQFTQDKCSLLDNFMVGDTVTVSYNLRGKQYQGKDGSIKYFNSIEGWKIDKPAQAQDLF